MFNEFVCSIHLYVQSSCTFHPLWIQFIFMFTPLLCSIRFYVQTIFMLNPFYFQTIFLPTHFFKWSIHVYVHYVVCLRLCRHTIIAFAVSNIVVILATINCVWTRMRLGGWASKCPHNTSPVSCLCWSWDWHSNTVAPRYKWLPTVWTPQIVLM